MRDWLGGSVRSKVKPPERHLRLDGGLSRTLDAEGSEERRRRKWSGGETSDGLSFTLHAPGYFPKEALPYREATIDPNHQDSTFASDLNCPLHELHFPSARSSTLFLRPQFLGCRLRKAP